MLFFYLCFKVLPLLAEVEHLNQLCLDTVELFPILNINVVYGASENFIDHTHCIVIIQAAKNTRLKEFDVKLLKVLFMTKYVENFPKNVENFTTFMILNINVDRIELRKKVEVSLKLLCDEMLV